MLFCQAIYKTRANVWASDETLGENTVFKTADRIKLIISKIESTRGANIDLQSTVFNQYHPLVQSYFPEMAKKQ